MVNKTNSDNSQSSSDDFKDQNMKHNLSKFDYDLYHDEDNVAEKVIRIKRFDMPNKGEKWKLFEDNKVILVIEGTKLSNKEKEFLRTVDGINFILKTYKSGITSFNELKLEIKKKINEP